MAKPKTMKVSQLIEALQNVLNEKGDAKVYLSMDEEGNGFGTLEERSVGWDPESKVLVLYPWQEFLYFE